MAEAHEHTSGGNGSNAPVLTSAPVTAKIPEPVISPAASPPPAPRPIAPPPAPPRNIVQRLREDPDGEGPRMGFIDHLMELRRCLWISVISVVVCVFLSLIFYHQLFSFMRAPLDNTNDKYVKAYIELNKHKPPGPMVELISINPLDTMLMIMWLAVGAGLVLSSPVIVYEIWSFISPGLRQKEKDAIKPVLYGGIFFFLGGVAIAYYFLFPVSIDFFVWLNMDVNVGTKWTTEYYTDLLINVMAVSGLCCELPLIVGVLAKLDVITPQHLTKYWRICILGSFILGAVISPGNDVMSMGVFTLLFLGLYFVSILMAYLFYKKTPAPA